MNGSNKATITISLAFFLLFIAIACGKGNISDLYYCNPNFTQDDFGLKVTYLTNSTNTFHFKVCYNENYQGSQVSIYGVEQESDIATMTPSADVRVGHMTDGLIPGQEFDVHFNDNDAWFIIYKDDNSGDLDTTTEIIRGEFR